ncbi:hypothetical protein CUMW_199910 [Citrus unshiu]|uniref:Uncharacterized protein n=1 Tax=Citrus unshiu TaxID=55188 RepID=A0A2H5Q697_CITUN|nr:hypothetical protein CUMW_199910 [Citrus unshiu]
MSQTNWEADKMLDVYIHDYLVKRDLKASAQAFQAEGKVSSDPVGKCSPVPLSMHLGVFCLSGGRFFGIYSLLERMRSIRRLLHPTSRHN